MSQGLISSVAGNCGWFEGSIRNRRIGQVGGHCLKLLNGKYTELKLPRLLKGWEGKMKLTKSAVENDQLSPDNLRILSEKLHILCLPAEQY